MTAKKMEKKAAVASTLGLDQIGDLSSLLQAGTARSPSADAGPLSLDLAVIDEDPDQPRHPDNPGFAAESLDELADTIRSRGVKTPISVRPNPATPNRYIINHGARRVRAARIAGKSHIPAFVDEDYTAADQMIENLQRDGLTAREIADFIGREIARGRKKGEIAKAIGKSASFVSQHVTLLDLPDPIAEAFTSGRSGDVTLINELAAAYKAAPDEVTTWLADDTQDITRGAVKLLREYIAEKNSGDAHDPRPEPEPAARDDAHFFHEEVSPADRARPAGTAEKMKKAIVLVHHAGKTGRLLLTRRPSSDGAAWIKYDDDSEEEVEAALISLVSIIEG